MKTVLAIDDSPSIRLMVAHTIRTAGYQVTEAASGTEALELVATSSFDMIFTDQNMPGIDGLTFIRMLRQRGEYKHTPIIVLTTEMGEEMKLKGRAAGATGWMVKPFHPDSLLNVVKRAIG
ncbi:MAG TPA: response regulator [Candidatus Acidoferrales bacterium]|jgi:two-component system chemotaxis response regulator CheY|nr:response regulator [Candidatus Acidoferrales bacterium]